MKKLKIGVVGSGRGFDLAKNFMLLDCDVVALCDSIEHRRENGIKRFGDGITVYDDFDKFIEHGLDAVILANFFHEHTPLILKCFERNIHVFCECISNSTMAEGVALARAFEKTKSIFMLAENYPQMLFNIEMQRVCKSGTLGKILFAEGEYNHPGNPEDSLWKSELNYFPKHWRNFLPRTYYITHSLGPVMCATGATPKRVTAFYSYCPPKDSIPTMNHVADRAGIITTLNDDDSVFRITGNASFGGADNSYRFCGTKGQIENVRGMDDKVMLRYNDWEKPEGQAATSLYEPSWNDPDEALIAKSGHGGSDFVTARIFLDCLKEGKQPAHPFDLHSSIAMSSVAILGHRSALAGGMPYDIPDFRNEDDRKKYENDNDSPFYYSDGREPTIPCCSHPDYLPSDEQIKKYSERYLQSIDMKQFK